MKIFLIYFSAFFASALTLDIYPTEWSKCDKNVSYVYEIEAKFSGMKITYGKSKLIQDFGKVPLIATINIANGDNYIPVARYRNEDACILFTQVGSQLFLDIQRAAGIMRPGSCPIPKGQYVIKNFEIKFNRFGIQAFPNGKFRLDIKIVGSIKGVPYGCYNLYYELA